MIELIQVKSKSEKREVKLIIYFLGFMCFETLLFYLGNILQSEVVSRILIVLNIVVFYLFFGALFLVGKRELRKYGNKN